MPFSLIYFLFVAFIPQKCLSDSILFCFYGKKSELVTNQYKLRHEETLE